MKDLLQLSKPRIVGLIILTVVAGFLLAARGGADPVILLHAVMGTAMVAAGTNALNQLMERDVDALMKRTRVRPLPAGRLSPAQAGAFGWAASASGVIYLALLVNMTTAVVALATLLSYVFVYTPLKRKSTLSTLIGAIPGALPIVGGWTAGGGALGLQAWVLFWIMFLWQLPHFLALAWIYRDDYRRAGLRMLSVDDADGRETFHKATLYSLALLPVSLAPAALRMSGVVYFAGALILSGWLVGTSLAAARHRSATSAGRLFGVCNLYLPALLALMVLSHGI